MIKFRNNIFKFSILLKIILSVFLILLAGSAESRQLQVEKGRMPQVVNEKAIASPTVRESEKKIEKQNKKQKKQVDKAKKKAHEDHINRQAPEVRERMKESEKESSKYRTKTNIPFYKRWFNRKRN